MKYLIVSDIHGCLPRLEKVLSFFEAGDYDLLLLLGDILNYGPRNGVPEGLDAQGIAERLNAMKDRIIAVRGNCDSEVDQMLLQFPIMSDYTVVVVEGRKIFLTHGHIYNEENMPAFNADIFIYGHTHRQKLEQIGNTTICNTGSITFPKAGNPPTFATYEDDTLSIRDLDGDVLSYIYYKV